ncbi:MAG: universal stress protein [Capsulimonadales bacterium]|nr:universal stress protein [Capsulimonadales bacterium]
MLKILYATDGSASASGAARFLARLPHPDSVSIHLLTVRPTGERSNGEGERILADVRSVLTAFSGAIHETIAHADGNAKIAETIIFEARRVAADLIVLGIGGQSAWRRLLVGSVADVVVRKAPLPVMLAGPVVGDAFDRILIGFDGSEHARIAAAWLPRLPLSEQCAVRLFSVVLPHPVFTGGAGILLKVSGTDPDRLSDRDRERIAAAAPPMIAELRRMGVSVPIGSDIVEDRDAGEALIEAARADRTDLVIVGSKGTTGAEDALLGSVSEHILHHAPCSVLVVRPVPGVTGSD